MADVASDTGHKPEVIHNEKPLDISGKARRLHEYSEEEGYVVDADKEGALTGVKVAKDGHTRLIPQPSDDPNDPLNWSWGRKHVILLIIAYTSFLPDFGSATGAVTLIPQAEYVFPPVAQIVRGRYTDMGIGRQWNMTQDEVNHSQVGNVFMLGAAALFSKSPASTHNNRM